MELIEKSNSLQFHYLFKDNSHSVDSILRNECEKEILHIFKEIAETLRFKISIDTLPTKEGGFIETWKIIGDNSVQITLIISVAAIIMSRFPVKNKKLTNLQIENLKLDNELKQKELDKLNLAFLHRDEELTQKIVADSANLVNNNYKISWRKSNLYKRLENYSKVDSIEILRYKDEKPVGKTRKISKHEFSKFILKTNELPKIELENVIIDVISPAIKTGKFTWKGFYNKDIINFLMNDYKFKTLVLNGTSNFSNNYSIEVKMTQNRKINEDGDIKFTNTIVRKVIASVENGNRIEY